MKKIYTLIFSLMFSSTIAFGQFYDNFDSYTVGKYLGPQSKDWTTWSFNDGGPDDILVDDTKPFSGKNSLYFVGQNGGGPHDVLLDFGGVHDKGRFKYSMMMYIPSKKSAYFNFQGGSTVNSWSMEMSFYTSNTYNVRNTNVGTLLNGSSFPVDQWFLLTIDADLDNDLWKLYFNTTLEGSFTNTLDISFIDIYEEDINAEYWIDDVSFCVNNACNPEISMDKVVVKTNPICTFDSSDVDITLTNNSTFSAPSVTLGIDVAGNLISKKIDLNNLAGGKDTTFTIKNLFVSKVAGNNVTVKAINLSGDVVPKNDTATTSVKVNQSPNMASFVKNSSFITTRPSSTGTMSDPDILISGGNYTYEINAPQGYSNGNYNSTWVIPNIVLTTTNGTAINTSMYTFTAPSTSKGTILFKPDNTLIDSSIIISFSIADKTSGCDTTIMRYIYIAPVPKASFTVSNPCLGENAIFKNTSTILKGLLTHQWDFGDGTQSTDAEPKHAFATAGIYNVKLIVTSIYDLKDSVTIQVNVVPIPKAKFNVINSCEGDSIQLIDASTYSGAIPEFTWSFDDGSADIVENTGKIRKIFIDPRTYEINMQISVNGCSDNVSKTATYAPRVKPDFNFTLGNCDNSNVDFTNNTPDIIFGTVGYTWDFGDNKTSYAKNPLHTYNVFKSYNVTLYTNTDLGCKDSAIKTITLKESAKINAAFSGPNCTNSGTSFKNTTTTPTGTTVTYEWDFGDGATSSDATPPHDYVAPGKYTVTVQALASNGCLSQKTFDVVINEKPTVKFISDKNNVCAGSEIQFSNQVTYSGSGMVYNWNFGNGNTSTDANPIHKFTKDGTFDVTLVANVATCKDSATMAIVIVPLPDATFTPLSTNLGLGSFVLTPNQSNQPGTYHWNFGDNSDDGFSKTSFTHQYPKMGFFKTCLTRTNGECESISCENITVNAASITQNSQVNFNIYPNPNNGNFNVEVNDEVSNDIKISITNILGETILTFKNKDISNNKLNINMDNEAAGIYFVTIEDNNFSTTKKISLVK